MTSLLVTTGVVALVTWAVTVGLVGAVARARRPEPQRRRLQEPHDEPLREPTDPAMRRILLAVRRCPGGNRLRDALVAAALEGLLEREAVRIDMRRDGPWAEVDDGPVVGLARYERVLLDHVREASARAEGPLPLAALRPARGSSDERDWARRLVEAAVAWGRRSGYLRDLVGPSVRGWLIGALLVPVEVLIAAALVANRADFEAVGSAVGAGVFGVAVLGFVFTNQLQGHGLTAAANRALAAPGGAPVASPRPLARKVARLLTTSGRSSRAWSSAAETWRPVRISTRRLASRDHDPRAVRNANLATLVVVAPFTVFLLWVTPTALRLSDVSAFFVLVWWGAWLMVAPRAALRLAAALSDLRTGPVVWTGQVVQRRPGDSDASGPDRITESLPVVAVDIGGGTVRTFAVDPGQYATMSPGTWVRAVVTPRLHHLLSIDVMSAPGGVGLPPTPWNPHQA